jgi:hypothetical protein
VYAQLSSFLNSAQNADDLVSFWTLYRVEQQPVPLALPGTYYVPVLSSPYHTQKMTLETANVLQHQKGKSEGHNVQKYLKS